MSVDLNIYAFYYNTPNDESMILLKANLEEICSQLSEIAKSFNLEDKIPTIEKLREKINDQGYYKGITEDFVVYIQQSNIKFDIKSVSSLFKVTAQAKKN